MKVLFVSNIPSPYRVDFFNELGKYTNLTVTFEREKASDRNDKWVRERAQNYEEIVFDGLKLGSDKAITFRVLKVLNRKWDAVIITGYSTPTAMLSIWYLKKNRKPFFIEADGGFIRNECSIKKYIKRYFVSSASGWFLGSKESASCFEHYGAEKSRIYYYPFTSIFEADLKCNSTVLRSKKSYKEELGIKEEKIILFVGQIIKRKGVDDLIKASELIDKSVGIYIVGGEPTKELLQIMNNSKYNPGRIHFEGFKHKDELDAYYRAADLFVLPTREDVWGLVINEAMSYGLPIITTLTCLAGKELVIDGENGRIIHPDDPGELAEAANEVLSENKYLEYGLKSLDLIKDYTIEKMTYAHMSVLKDINTYKSIGGSL